MHGLWCPQRHRCSPGSALSGAAGRWVPGRAGRRAPQWVTAPRSLPPALAPPPCSPLFQLMRGRPRALPHRRRAGNPRRHPRESHSGYGHSGQGGRSTRSRRPDSGGGDARPLGTPQWVHSGRACTTVTRARRRAGRRGLGATGLCSTAACWGVASAGLRLYRGEWYGLTPRRRDRCLTVPAGEAGCAAATAAWATCSRWDQHRDTAVCECAAEWAPGRVAGSAAASRGRGAVVRLGAHVDARSHACVW
jgi:hypothetical protein